jgi:hypothetical protein
MDQQLPVGLSSDLPPFNWDEFRESKSSSEPTSPLLHESAASDINSLLSARSYPLPNAHNTQNAQNSTLFSSHGDLPLGFAPYLNPTNTNQIPLPKPTAPGPQKRQRRGSKKAAPSGKNREAPQDEGGRNESHEEVRRPWMDLQNNVRVLTGSTTCDSGDACKLAWHNVHIVHDSKHQWKASGIEFSFWRPR